MRGAAQGALDRLAARLDQPIRAEIEPEGWSTLNLKRLQIGPEGEPWLTVDRVKIEADLSALWSRKVALRAVSVHRPTLRVEGDGTALGAVEAVRDRLLSLRRQRPQAAPTEGDGDAPFIDTRYALQHPPPVTVFEAAVRDRAGALEATAQRLDRSASGEISLRQAEISLIDPRFGSVEGRLEVASGAWGAPLYIGAGAVQLRGPDDLRVSAGLLGAEISPAGAFTAAITVGRPDLGTCALTGDLTWGHIRCSDPLTVPLPGGVQITADRLTVARRPALRLQIPGVQIATDQAHPMLAQLSGAELELNAGWTGDRWPFEIEVALRAGSRLRARGAATAEALTLDVSAEAVDLPDLLPVEAGTLDVAARLQATPPRRRADPVYADLAFDLRTEGVIVDRPGLAPEPVGPFGFALSGDAELTVPRLDDPEALRLAVGAPLVSLRGPEGHIDAAVSGLLDLTGEAPVIYAKGDTGSMDAAALPGAFPEGLIPLLSDIGLRGRFGLRGRLYLDLADPEDLGLRVKANTRRLRITRLPSQMRFDRLRTRFTTRFEMPDETVITREVGPETDRWLTLDQVPPLLPIAIMAQEDGGFFKHGGISMFHLRESLGQNLSKGRFFRGGSTLTMQLARNLYLNHRKTLSRKLQELVVAWLLEQNFTKSELLTLYINVVEFGPDVFGIKEAAAYYFDKDPLDLTTVETIFLVRLLPGPRLYHEQFVKRKLSRGFANGIKRLISLLISREQLPPEAAIGRQDEIVLWP